MVTVPAPTPVAMPELLIVATDVFDEDHATIDVMFLVLLSVYVPVAVNCFFVPLEMVGLTGVMLMDCSTALVTVKTDESERLPNVARMVDLPVPAPVAKPVLLIVATDVFDENHVTLIVRSCVLVSLYVPVAVNCFVRPFAMYGSFGLTLMDCSTGLVTVSPVEPEMLPDAAPIVDMPVPVPVARPSSLIFATDVVEEDHLTLSVRFLVLPSVYVPVAVNCCEVPLGMDGFTGATVMV